ncbi:MAG TPA: type IX secretion system protein PorQ [Bacteroidia bacterium]|nr:type IX secretion system protein PorQ [Bacteroidia bacterium]
MSNRFCFRITFLAVAILSGFYNNAAAQIGGSSTYAFLNLSSSARIAALGGKLVPVKDNDLNLVFANPAVLNPTMDHQLTFSGVGYFAGIRYGYAAYASEIKKAGMFSAGMHYVDYGHFDETDETGEVTGSFKAGEYSLNLTWAKQLADSAFSFGVTLKTIYSSLESYTSYGLAADLGANYYIEPAMVNLSLVAKNAGRQLKAYREGNIEPLPFEVELGVSKQLAKAPFRFSLILQHLEKPDMTFTDPAKEGQLDPITGEPLDQKITTGDKILRHVILGTELLISKNFNVRFGYNFQRRKELGVDTKMGTTGLSWGFGFRISKFIFSYGRSTYHLAGASNSFSISANLNEFVKKQD